MRPTRKPRQEWAIGNTVRVGFLTLTIIGFEPATGDGLPGAWLLNSHTGSSYRFTPYNGLETIDNLR